MSQAGIISSSASPPPPPVPTSFVTDVNSPSVPIANIEKVFGGTSTANNTNGVRTDGSSGSNTLTVQLTNRIVASVTTTDGVTPVTAFTFPLGATPGTYLFNQYITAYDTTSQLGAVYSGVRGVRTTGAAGALINSNMIFEGEEGTFNEGGEIINSIVGNNLVLTITGLAGKTIDWVVLNTYIFAS